MYVVGVSSGVSIWKLEQYVIAPYKDGSIIELTVSRWVLEVYRTIIETLQGIAWLLLVFFAVTLIVFVIVQVFEFRYKKAQAGNGEVKSQTQQ